MTHSVNSEDLYCKGEAKVWSSDGTIVGFSFKGSHYGFNVTYKCLMHLVYNFMHEKYYRFQIFDWFWRENLCNVMNIVE